MAAHLLFGLFALGLGILFVYGAIKNTEGFARTALGRNSNALYTEQDQARIIQKVGHSTLYRVVMGIIGAGMAVAGLVYMFRP